MDKFRRADNGQYTTEEYAIQHPKTTVKEKDKKCGVERNRKLKKSSRSVSGSKQKSKGRHK